MASYQDLINKGQQKRNWYDSLMGISGSGVDNRNYVPGYDEIKGDVTPLTLSERISGISLDEKRARQAEIELSRRKENTDYEYLESYGKNPELGKNVSDADLKRKAEALRALNTQKVAAQVAGVDSGKLGTVLSSDADMMGQAAQLAELTRLQKEQNTNEAYKRTPQYLDAQKERARLIALEEADREIAATERQRLNQRQDIADDRLAFDRQQAAQLRRDQLIENKEARLGNQELAMLQLNRDERMHNNELEYRRELHKRERIDNIAASLSSLAMAFFV